MAQRKNNIQNIVILLVVVAILAFAGLQAFNVAEPNLSKLGKYIEAPTFGYMNCAPTQQITVRKTMSGEFGQANLDNPNVATSYTCKDFIGMNNGCTITMQIIANEDNRLDKPYLGWQKTIARGSFSRANIDSLREGDLFYQSYTIGETTETISMGRDDVLWVIYTEGLNFIGDKKVNGKVQFIVQGAPFTLYNHNIFSSDNGKILEGARTGSCYLESSYYRSRAISYADPELKELEGKDAELDWRNVNKPFGVYTYFAGAIPVPSYNLRLQEYNGETVYCMDKQLRKIYNIQVGGYSYDIVNYEASGYIKSVLCCNGDETPDKICVDNKWVNKDEADCDLSRGLFCPQSTYEAYADKQYKRFECIDNECVADIIQVDCNKDSDCSSGEVCVYYSDPDRNQCVELGGGGTPVCGDGKCETYERNSCGIDCGVITSPSFGVEATIILIILAVVAIIAVMLVIKMRMNKAKGKK